MVGYLPSPIGIHACLRLPSHLAPALCPALHGIPKPLPWTGSCLNFPSIFQAWQGRCLPWWEPLQPFRCGPSTCLYGLACPYPHWDRDWTGAPVCPGQLLAFLFPGGLDRHPYHPSYLQQALVSPSPDGQGPDMPASSCY